jgi:dihydrofolate reductase
MKKIILAMSISLDGFIEGKDHDTTWMHQDSPEDWKQLFRMLESVDLLLLGGGMFAEYRDHWKQALTNPKASAGEVQFARWAEKHKHIVFSKTIKDPQWQNTEINNGNVIEEVRKIKSQPGKDIYVVGGAKFASSVLDAGLVDELRMVVNPWILGEGKSLFSGNKKRHAMQLVETKNMDGGLVLLRYSLNK